MGGMLRCCLYGSSDVKNGGGGYACSPVDVIWCMQVAVHACGCVIPRSSGGVRIDGLGYYSSQKHDVRDDVGW
jgi:hypothetical protein